jgi:hypothetical protein
VWNELVSSCITAIWKAFLRLFFEAKVLHSRYSLRLHLCGAPVKTCVFECLYAYIITAERILMKIDIGELYENLSIHFTFRLDWKFFKLAQQETDRHFCTRAFTSLFCACAYTCLLCTWTHITTSLLWSVVDCNEFSRISAFHTTSHCSHVVRIRESLC